MASSAKVIAGGGIGLATVVALSIPLVEHWEGKRNDPYRDIGGKLTWCYGETAGTPKARYTDAECSAMLERSLTSHARGVLVCIPEAAPLETKAAFVSFGYNVGVSAACSSRAAKRLRAGDVVGACNALLNWVYVGKRRVQGLVNRRTAERALCLKGVPA